MLLWLAVVAPRNDLKADQYLALLFIAFTTGIIWFFGIFLLPVAFYKHAKKEFIEDDDKPNESYYEGR